MQSIVISVYVCLSVCLFIFLFVVFSVRCHISKTAVQISPNLFLYTLPVTLCTSGFMDDAVFSYNGGNRPQSKTTRVSSIRQVAAPGAKTFISRYLIWSFLFAIKLNYYYASGRGCEVLPSVCMCICLSVCLSVCFYVRSHISKPEVYNVLHYIRGGLRQCHGQVTSTENMVKLQKFGQLFSVFFL